MTEALPLGQRRAQEMRGYISDNDFVIGDCEEQDEEEETDKEDDQSTDDERSEADCGAHTLQMHTRQIRELYRLTAKLQQQLHHTAAHTQVGAAVSLNNSHLSSEI